jgi:ATP-dependent Clp protease ATP-binding subunit ClpC
MNLGLKLDEVRDEVLNLLGAGTESEDVPGGGASPRGRGPGGRQTRAEQDPALDSFGRDLTELAKASKLDPVIGRAGEIERVVQILCRRQKNNPVLLGEAGVGKTAIVEGLATRIVEQRRPRDPRRSPHRRARPGHDGRGHQVPRPVRRAHQGGHERGAPREERDPVHRRAAHAGRSRRRGRAIDAPTCSSRPSRAARSSASARPRSTSTASTSRRTAPSNAASSDRRRPAQRRADVEILKGLRDRTKPTTASRSPTTRLASAVELSGRYITGRVQPDKSIDVIDEAGARVRIKSMTKPPTWPNSSATSTQLNADKDEAVRTPTTKGGGAARPVRIAEKKKVELRSEWRDKIEGGRRRGGRGDHRRGRLEDDRHPADSASRRTRPRACSNSRRNCTRRSSVRKRRSRHRASRSAARAAGLKDPNRPMGSFIFVGPSGVGKTCWPRRWPSSCSATPTR